jgi:ring-1,2-phenylacetyl-CoA epoxidase subunit PaaD
MTANLAPVWAALDELSDPEIPVLTLRDLGIVRDVRAAADGRVEVVITPTYSGCPAIGQIEDDVRTTLQKHGIDAQVVTQLSPAWTTDWMSDAGKDKLREYGIAPPRRAAGRDDGQALRFIARAATPDVVPCPRCGSAQTVETSRFASTACKALYKCLACQEPFDYFKPY